MDVTEPNYKPLLDMMQNVFKSYLIDDTQENLDKVLSVFNEYLQLKITRKDTEDELRTYLRSLDPLFEFDKIMNQSNTTPEPKPFLNEDPSKNRQGGRKKSKPWTPEEDEQLAKAIQDHGTNNWGAVAAYVGGDRTRAQCSQRWNRVINPNISKANWSKEEEDKLLSIVAQLGNKAWTRVAAQFGNRTDVQCRFKYNYLMKKGSGINEIDYQQFLPDGQLEAPKEEVKETEDKKDEDMKLE